MARAFPDPGKGFPHSLESLRAATAGGAVADSLPIRSGAVATVLDPSVFESAVNGGGTGANEVVQLPAGPFVGARHLVTFAAEGAAGDVVRINGAAGVALQSQGAVGETPVAVTNIDLDTPGEFALLEYQGGDTWNLLYTDGVTS